jgi:hypothetical protein
MLTATRPRLTTEELQTILLAASAYPDADFRHHLAARLDEAIEANGPLHSAEEVERLLAHKHGPRRMRFALPWEMREVAARVLRLAFARAPGVRPVPGVRITCDDPPEPTHGLLIDRDLRARTQRPPHSDRRRRIQARWGCELHAGIALTRLGYLRTPAPEVRVTCRDGEGYCLELSGDLPWPPGTRYFSRHRLGDRGFDPGEFDYEMRGETLRLKLTTPEAMISFAARMARGEVLKIAGPYGRGQVLVRLREFDGDEAELSAVRSDDGRQGWLNRVPAAPLALTAEERLLLTRWANPMETWINETLETDS